MVAATSQAAQLSLVGEANSSRYLLNGAGARAKTGYGAGLLMDFKGRSPISLQIGALYMKRTTLGFRGGADVFPHIQVPALLRVWLKRWLVLGMGGYGAYGYGQGRTFYSRGISQMDYGLVGSLALYYRLSYNIAFLMDGRYCYGLADVSNVNLGYNWRDTQFLAGFKFGAR